MSGVEDQIRELLVATGTLNRRKVALTSRLFHDLHLDGDDAAEFFASVEKQFGTDLATLYTPWTDHFGPEFSNSFVRAAAGVLIAIVAGFLRRANNGVLLTQGVLFIALIAITLWVALLARHRMKSITVGDVVSAVEQSAKTDVEIEQELKAKARVEICHDRDASMQERRLRGDP